MKVLLTFYGAEMSTQETSPEVLAEIYQAWAEFGAAATEAGVLLACEGLEGPNAATTIRVAADGRHVTDGPFLETKEQLGGFLFMEVRDLDEAMEWAARTPWNGEGNITEIRPVRGASSYGAQAEASEATVS